MKDEDRVAAAAFYARQWRPASPVQPMRGPTPADERWLRALLRETDRILESEKARKEPRMSEAENARLLGIVRACAEHNANMSCAVAARYFYQGLSVDRVRELLGLPRANGRDR